jgi:hypothetical protein
MQWYIPTWNGDFSLEATEPKKTLLRANDPTEAEKIALRALAKKKYVDAAKLDAFLAGGYRENAALEIFVELDKVQKVVTKALKPERALLSAFKFVGGKMTQLFEGEMPPPEAKAAVTVALPTIGCPAPDFDVAHDRATRVLGVFLTLPQVEDFDRHGRFVSVGADTGHRYMLTSRRSPDIERFERSLFDLDDNLAFCVHDWAVPAPEELLGLHVFLSVPGGEAYLRQLTE